MKLRELTVEMTCTLSLNERECEMLGYLAGYDAKSIALAITKELTKTYQEKEWEEFWSKLRAECEASTRRFADTRAVFNGTKKAKILIPPEGK